MKFWVISWTLYICALVAGLVLPGLARLDRGKTWWIEPSLDTLAFATLFAAPMVLTFMLAKRFFPSFWWLAQVLNDDVYHFDGVYFVGTRASRQKHRLQRIVFGVDESMRPWNIVFGLLFMALLLPHLMGGYSSANAFERAISKRPTLAETLHSATLSALPIMRQWQTEWSAKPSLALRVHEALRKSRSKNEQSNRHWFNIAQLQMLNAYQPRKDIREPFYYSPGDQLLFNRSEGAEAVSYMNRIINQPEEKRRGWTRGALTLIGFFHLSDRNPKLAADFFQRALAISEKTDKTNVTRHQVILLSAQAALLDKRPAEAGALLEGLLEDDNLPVQAYSLAIEHFADSLRLTGDTEQVPELLGKALDLYKSHQDRAGIARVHLRLAALAIEQNRGRDASREISLAASLAHGLEDGFTLNMVEGLSLYFPQVL